MKKGDESNGCDAGASGRQGEDGHSFGRRLGKLKISLNWTSSLLEFLVFFFFLLFNFFQGQLQHLTLLS